MKTSLATAAALCALFGCGATANAPPDSATPDASTTVEAAADALPLASLVADACAPLVEAHDAKYRAHVARDTEVVYDSNPPSWGLHYATWVEYGAHQLPVDRREYVHNAEHGGVVLLYKCDRADGCPSVARALEAIANAAPDEPFCAAAHTGVRTRVVVTPDPLLDTPLAAMAWGWTYKASCFDPSSLKSFLGEHLGKGPENNCEDGGGGSVMSAP